MDTHDRSWSYGPNVDVLKEWIISRHKSRLEVSDSTYIAEEREKDENIQSVNDFWSLGDNFNFTFDRFFCNGVKRGYEVNIDSI